MPRHMSVGVRWNVFSPHVECCFHYFDIFLSSFSHASCTDFFTWTGGSDI